MGYVSNDGGLPGLSPCTNTSPSADALRLPLSGDRSARREVLAKPSGNKLRKVGLEINNSQIKRIQMIKHWIIPAVLFLIMGACASTKPPSQQLTQLETSIKQAEQVGAENYAPLELREARKKLEKARELVNEEEYEEAELVAEKAMVDAELAQIKTLSSKSQQAVDQLRESIRVLQEEIRKNINREQN